MWCTHEHALASRPRGSPPLKGDRAEQASPYNNNNTMLCFCVASPCYAGRRSRSSRPPHRPGRQAAPRKVEMLFGQLQYSNGATAGPRGYWPKHGKASLVRSSPPPALDALLHVSRRSGSPYKSLMEVSKFFIRILIIDLRGRVEGPVVSGEPTRKQRKQR